MVLDTNSLTLLFSVLLSVRKNKTTGGLEVYLETHYVCVYKLG